MTSPFSSMQHALAELRAGRMVILVDDEQRENEGDLVFAAEHVTPEAINFMSRFGRGLICLPMAGAMIDKLGLPMMASRNRSPYGTGLRYRSRPFRVCRPVFLQKIAPIPFKWRLMRIRLQKILFRQDIFFHFARVMGACLSARGKRKAVWI